MIKDGMKRSMFGNGKGNLGQRPGFTYFIVNAKKELGADDYLFCGDTLTLYDHDANHTLFEAYTFFCKMRRMMLGCPAEDTVWGTVYNDCILGQAFVCAMIQANVGISKYEGEWTMYAPSFRQFVNMLAKCIRRHVKAGASFGFKVMSILRYCESNEH